MVYFTGDIHSSFDAVFKIVEKVRPNERDVVVLLGDVGANYYGGERDAALKRLFGFMSPTFLCVHGNHEMRPANVDGYVEKKWRGGKVWFQPQYPNLLFAKDGEIYSVNGIKYLVIGGAYSVDKFYRLKRGLGWWADEQPSDDTKQRVEQQVAKKKFDIILSHTCPFKYEPIEMFISHIDQKTVDDSTERWLDKIEESAEYKAWFCGHWHTDKRIDKMHFLFHSIESDDQFRRKVPKEQ